MVNSAACRKLQELGASRVTLSYELNKKRDFEADRAYETNYGARPSLEMIVLRPRALLFTKYCPLKNGTVPDNASDISTNCGTNTATSGCFLTRTARRQSLTANSSILDEMPSVKRQAFRLAFATKRGGSIPRFWRRGENSTASGHHLFAKDTDTRGHYNKEIIGPRTFD